MLPPPKGGGFVVTDSSPVPSEARLKLSPPQVSSKPSPLRWPRSPPTPGGLNVPVLHAQGFRAWLPRVRDRFRHHLVPHVPAAPAEGPPRPPVPAPELLPPRRECGPPRIRRLPLQPRPPPADRHRRRDRHPQGPVLRADLTLEVGPVRRPADRPDPFPKPHPHRAHQHRRALLRHPDQGPGDREHAGRPRTVLLPGADSHAERESRRLTARV